MKWAGECLAIVVGLSPSMRREWIEIFCRLYLRGCVGVSLHAEEWIEMILFCILSIRYMSPSMRREWIEI